jgi:hypothetical protein
VFVALATAWAGGESMVLLRRLNGQLARANLDRLAAGSARSVVGLQLAGIGGDLVRGFALTVVALGVAQPLVRRALAAWSVDERWSTAFVVTAAAIVAGGAVWKLVHAVPRARWLFLGGLAIGLVAMRIW